MTYFVRIDSPVELRRNLLRSAKDSILYQYEYQEFKDLRQEKKQVIAEIDKTYKDLEEHVDALLTNIDIEEIHEDIEAAIDEQKMHDEDDSEADDEEVLTDTDRLKYTLDRIESTLDEL